MGVSEPVRAPFLSIFDRFFIDFGIDLGAFFVVFGRLGEGFLRFFLFLMLWGSVSVVFFVRGSISRFLCYVDTTADLPQGFAEGLGPLRRAYFLALPRKRYLGVLSCFRTLALHVSLRFACVF